MSTEILEAARRGDYTEVIAYSGIDVRTMDAILVTSAFNGHARLVNWCLERYQPRLDVMARAIQYAQLRGFTEIMMLLL
jgi:hypothetical protein